MWKSLEKNLTYNFDDNMKKIAVILPVYKNDKVDYVKLSFDSILNQTYQNFHLYIGVDGPVDEHLVECLKGYEQDKRVTVVWFKINRGLAVVLNELLNICFKEGYEYIARMDADDISRLDRFEKQVNYFEEHPDYDVISGATHQIDENGQSRNITIYRKQDPNLCRKQFAYENPLSHPATMFRKRFFDKTGCRYREDHRINQDTLLWYDGLKKEVVISNVPDVILDFRNTNDMFKKRRGGFKKAQKQLKDRLMINRGLHYGIKADIYAFAVFLMMISPVWIRRCAYKAFNK